ncbi:MAG: universal stress protein [Thermodesulfovibrionales bacterium]|nr:universal stress protein [Thermodesulfovibrionales bacterium]
MGDKIFAKLDNLLITTDGSEFSEGAVREGIRLAKNSGAKVTALYVVEFNPEFEALAPNLVEKMEIEAAGQLKGIKEKAVKEGVSCTIFMRRSDSPYKAIVDEAAGESADVIVMGRRGRTGLKRLLMGSVTAKVIGHARCNVLVVPRAANIYLRNILIATDGSRYGIEAASMAVGIAKRSAANLIAVSVVPSEAAPFIQAEMQKGLIAEKELKEAEKNVAAVKAMAQKEGISAEGIVAAGHLHEAILEIAKEKNVDLIVVGSHGRTGITRLLMGSVAERVIGHADCAVLVVKAG